MFACNRILTLLTGGERFQTFFTDPIKGILFEILLDRRKNTVKQYLKKHVHKVQLVVMDMSPSFKAAIDEVSDKPVAVVDKIHYCDYIH